MRFALAADLCRPSPRYGGEWLEFHPLFREALLRRLEREETPQTLANLHARAAAWFEAAELPDAAIGHWLAAGEVETAVALVEREIQPAFDREDWPAVARWLTLLPEETVQEHLPLLLAKGWVAHLRGRSSRLMEIVRLIEERLARGDVPEAARTVARAEVDLMRHGTLLPIQIDPERALATLRAVIDHVPPDRRYQYGLAWTLYGMALQATGQGHEAVEQLARWRRRRRSASTPARPAGSSASSSSTGRPATSSASRASRGPRTRWRPGMACRCRPAGGIASSGTSSTSATTWKAPSGSMRSWRATTNPSTSRACAKRSSAWPWPTTRLAALRRAGERCGVAARSCSMRGRWSMFRSSRPTRRTWPSSPVTCHERWRGRARASVGVDSAPLYFVVHPSVIRAAILCAAGDAASLDEATALLEEVRQRAARAHFTGALVRIEALLAVAHVKRGAHDAGVAAMRRSLATGGPQGYTRTYLDLLPLFTPEVRQLAPEVDLPAALRAALETPRVPPTRVRAHAPSASWSRP